MRKRAIDLPVQVVKSKDGTALSIEATLYYQPTNAIHIVSSGKDFLTPAIERAQSRMNEIINSLSYSNPADFPKAVDEQLQQYFSDAQLDLGYESHIEIRRIEAI